MRIAATNPCAGKPLPRVTPESVGVSSRDVMAFVQAAKERNINLHSFLLLRHDQVYAESYYAPYAPDQLQTVYSLSKSFTSVAVGIAAGEGILDLDERIVDLFADEIEGEPCPELAALTLRNCLRMSTGQPKEIPGPDLVKAFLNMPFSDMPGEHFRYNSMATYMLSAALKKRGVDLEEYLQRKLFDPMGIKGLHWMRCGRGIPTGGFGLSILPEVIAKFGILLKNDGVWEGKRLIPHEYLALATSKRIDNSEGNKGEWACGYGYQFWMCRYDTFRGDGAFGQLCVVSPKQDAVLAMTAFTEDIQAELDVYFEHILLKMKEGALPEDPAAQKEAQEMLAAQRCFVAPVPDEGGQVPEELLGRALRTGDGHSLRLKKGPEDTLHFYCDVIGELTLTRGALADQIAPCRSDVMGYCLAEIQSRALAGYGVKKDGTVVVRADLLELLKDWQVELTPGAQDIKVRVIDVHLPDKEQVMYEGTAQ